MIRRAQFAPKGTYGLAESALPTFEPVLGRGVNSLSLYLHSADLGTHLSSWFGPRDEMAPGKYRKAEVFYFDGGVDGIVIAHCEKGDRGSAWFWAPHNGQPPGNYVRMYSSIAQAPPVWPMMLIDLAHRFALIDPDIDAKQVESDIRKAVGMEVSPGKTPSQPAVKSSPKKVSKP